MNRRAKARTQIEHLGDMMYEDNTYSTDEFVQSLSVEDKAIVLHDDGTKTIAGCHAGSWGLNVPDSATIEDIELATSTFIQMSDRLNLWVGDLLAAAERLNYGDMTAWAAELGYNVKTLSNWKFVCQSVPVSLREEVHLFYANKKPLTMGHYNLVTGLSYEEKRRRLFEALEHEWSVATLSTKIHGRQDVRPYSVRGQEILARLQSLMERAPDAERHQMAAALRALAEELEQDD